MAQDGMQVEVLYGNDETYTLPKFRPMRLRWPAVFLDTIFVWD